VRVWPLTVKPLVANPRDRDPLLLEVDMWSSGWEKAETAALVGLAGNLLACDLLFTFFILFDVTSFMLLPGAKLLDDTVPERNSVVLLCCQT